MANTKTSALTAATTPLTGAEVLAGVQGAANAKVSTDSIWRKSGGLWVPPASPSVYDDEFDATTLDAKWTVGGTAVVGSIDPYDTSYSTANGWRYSLTYRPGWMVGQASSSDSYTRKISQSGMTSAINAFYVVRIQNLNRNPAGYGGVRDAEFSMALYSTTSTTGAIISRNNSRVFAQKYDGGFSDIVNTALSAYGGDIEYLGIGKASNVFTFWGASSPQNWLYLGTMTLSTFDATHKLELSWRNSSAHTPGMLIYGLDFFRMNTTSATPPWP